MVSTTLQQTVCETCGTDVREGSAFCYNCGGSVEPEPAPPAILKPDPELLDGDALKAEKLRASADAERPITAPSGKSDLRAEVSAKKNVFPASSRERGAPRTKVKKVPEVEWVEVSAWSGSFLVAAVVLALIAALLISAAWYLG